MRTLPAIACLLILASEARAEDDRQEPSARESGSGSYLQAAARFTFPGGGISGIGSVGYSDLLDSGIGAQVQAGHLWRISRAVSIGGTLEGDYDSFRGGGDDIPGLFNTTVTTDPSHAFRLLGGAKVREELGASRLYFEQFLGFGAVFHSRIRGDVSNGMSNVELFAKSTRFAFDAGGSFGWSFTRRVEAFLSLSLQINDGPAAGRDIAIIAPNFRGDANAQLNVGLALGLNLQF
jgi:hypothetical protein